MQQTKRIFLSLAAAAALSFGVGATLASQAHAQVPAQKAPAKTTKTTLHIAGMT